LLAALRVPERLYSSPSSNIRRSIMLNRIKAACRRSLTIAWAYLVGVASAALMLLVEGAELIGAPEVKSQLATVLEPKTVAWIGLGVALVTLLARLRSLRGRP
jgi:hypothetical protein